MKQNVNKAVPKIVVLRCPQPTYPNFFLISFLNKKIDKNVSLWEEFALKSLFYLQIQQLTLYFTHLIMNEAYKSLVLHKKKF